MNAPRTLVSRSLRGLSRLQQIRNASVTNVRRIQNTTKEDPFDKYRFKLEQKAKE